MPPVPECTFDDGRRFPCLSFLLLMPPDQPPRVLLQQAKRPRIDTKNWRIVSVRLLNSMHVALARVLTFLLCPDELETLLRQKDSLTESPSGSMQPRKNSAGSSSSPTLTSSSSQAPQFNQATRDNSISPSNSCSLPDTRNGRAVSLTKHLDGSHEFMPGIVNDTSLGPAFGLDMAWPNWPPNLPGPELLRHL